jgi:hypothetical protein
MIEYSQPRAAEGRTRLKVAPMDVWRTFVAAVELMLLPGNKAEFPLSRSYIVASAVHSNIEWCSENCTAACAPLQLRASLDMRCE